MLECFLISGCITQPSGVPPSEVEMWFFKECLRDGEGLVCPVVLDDVLGSGGISPQLEMEFWMQ